jgi:hypothetical protein
MPRGKMLLGEGFVRTNRERREIMLTKVNSYVQLCRMAKAKIITLENRKPIPAESNTDPSIRTFDRLLLGVRRMYSNGFIDDDLQCTLKRPEVYFSVRL